MTIDSRHDTCLGDEANSEDLGRPYSAPDLIRLDTRATAAGVGGDTDGLLSS
jgi:hypothetical protein